MPYVEIGGSPRGMDENPWQLELSFLGELGLCLTITL